jgi:hypothetical protein
MMHVTGRYRAQCVELDQPIELADGSPVEVDIAPIVRGDRAERAHWPHVGMDRLEEEWDNREDAMYDDWKRLYGV